MSKPHIIQALKNDNSELFNKLRHDLKEVDGGMAAIYHSLFDQREDPYEIKLILSLCRESLGRIMRSLEQGEASKVLKKNNSQDESRL